MVEEILDKTREQMGKSLDFFQKQLAKVRTGSATASLLDSVKADFYGTMTPLPQMASVSAPDARTLVVQPWDRNMLVNIEKSIRQADLGFNPQNDGTIIRIPVPPLTEERRKEFVKLCKKYAEESRVAIRNIRRESLDLLKKAEKDKLISEDERKNGEDQIQKVTDEFVKKVDETISKKEKELLEF